LVISSNQGTVPPTFNYTYESLFYEARVSFDEGRQTKEQRGIQKDFSRKMRTSKYFATDGSKMENKPFVAFASIDISDGRSWKLRIAKITSTFMAEAPEIGGTLEVIEKIDWEQNFVILSDSDPKSLLKVLIIPLQ
jgi:hypothetical protein